MKQSNVLLGFIYANTIVIEECQVCIATGGGTHMQLHCERIKLIEPYIEEACTHTLYSKQSSDFCYIGKTITLPYNILLLEPGTFLRTMHDRIINHLSPVHITYTRILVGDHAWAHLMVPCKDSHVSSDFC